jgi:hypothetical protein
MCQLYAIIHVQQVGKNSWFSSKPDLSVKGRTSLYVPVGATLVGIESKPNLTEPKISETEKRSVTEEVLIIRVHLSSLISLPSPLFLSLSTLIVKLVDTNKECCGHICRK